MFKWRCCKSYTSIWWPNFWYNIKKNIIWF